MPGLVPIAFAVKVTPYMLLPSIPASNEFTVSNGGEVTELRNEPVCGTPAVLVYITEMAAAEPLEALNESPEIVTEVDLSCVDSRL